MSNGGFNRRQAFAGLGSLFAASSLLQAQAPQLIGEPPGRIAPHDELIKKHADYIRHVHINEMDGRHPTTGDYDFRVPLRGLKQINYVGWVSLEVFRFDPSGEEIARISSEYLRKLEEEISSS